MKDVFYFLLIPLLECLFYARNIKETNDILALFVYVSVSFLISIILFVATNSIWNVKKLDLRRGYVWIAFLVLVDQIAKMLVYSCKMDEIVWYDVFGIKPTRNEEQMAVLNFLKIDLGDSWIVFIKVMLIIIILAIFCCVRKKNRNRIYAFIFLMASAVATLLDSIIWGYTLDYIYFVGIVYYDLKDFYVNTAIAFVLMEQLGKDNCDYL